MQVYRFSTIAIYFWTSQGHYWPVIDSVGINKKLTYIVAEWHVGGNVHAGGLPVPGQQRPVSEVGLAALLPHQQQHQHRRHPLHPHQHRLCPTTEDLGGYRTFFLYSTIVRTEKKYCKKKLCLSLHKGTVSWKLKEIISQVNINFMQTVFMWFSQYFIEKILLRKPYTSAKQFVRKFWLLIMNTLILVCLICLLLKV